MRHVVALLLTVTVGCGLGPGSHSHRVRDRDDAREDQGGPVSWSSGPGPVRRPWAHINRNNEWVGFSIHLAEQGVLPAVTRKVGKPVKLEKKESRPATRVSLPTAQC